MQQIIISLFGFQFSDKNLLIEFFFFLYKMQYCSAKGFLLKYNLCVKLSV